MKEIINRTKFEHVLGILIFIAVYTAFIFGMYSSNNEVLTTVLSMFNVGFGAVIGYFFKSTQDKNKM